jgi:hypothetical protein
MKLLFIIIRHFALEYCFPAVEIIHQLFDAEFVVQRQL